MLLRGTNFHYLTTSTRHQNLGYASQLPRMKVNLESIFNDIPLHQVRMMPLTSEGLPLAQHDTAWDWDTNGFA